MVPAQAQTAGTESRPIETMAKLVEHQITQSRSGHILTNIGVWSPDGEWVVYDTGSTPAGDQFDGTRIEKVTVHSGEVRVLSVVVTLTVAHPESGSDQINKAFEEGWIGTNGYVRVVGSRQRHALAFQA
jgi:Tol biopolymer transport system component